MTEPERLSRPACIAATRELLRALPARCTGGGEPADRLQHHCAQRAQEALLVLSRGAGRSLGFGVDTVRDLDRLLAGHFVLNELSPGQVLDLGLIFAEILRRNFGGRYLWLADRDTLGLRIVNVQGGTTAPIGSFAPSPAKAGRRSSPSTPRSEFAESQTPAVALPTQGSTLTALPVDKVMQSLELQKPATLEGYLFILAKRQSTAGPTSVGAGLEVAE